MIDRSAESFVIGSQNVPLSVTTQGIFLFVVANEIKYNDQHCCAKGGLRRSHAYCTGIFVGAYLIYVGREEG